MHIQKKKFDWFSFLTVILAVLVGFEAVIGTAGIVTVNAMLKDKPTLNIEELYSQESTRIFDKDGNQISHTLEANSTYHSHDTTPKPTPTPSTKPAPTPTPTPKPQQTPYPSIYDPGDAGED